MASVTDGAMKKGAHAGNLIKAIAGLVGGGGGAVRTWHRLAERIRLVLQQPLKKRQK